jgi:hypothetical protein
MPSCPAHFADLTVPARAGRFALSVAQAAALATLAARPQEQRSDVSPAPRIRVPAAPNGAVGVLRSG